MKKNICLLLVFIISFSIFAVAPSKVLLATGNDLFSMGLSRNDDDQLSFSLNTSVEFDDKAITVDYNSITNRGWKNGWDIHDENKSSSEEFYNSRFDELKVIGSYRFDLNLKKLLLSVEPSVGLYLSGNLGSQNLQNSLHNVIGIHNISIPYDSSSISLRPLVALDSSLTFGYRNFRLGLSAGVDYIPSVRAMESFWFDTGFYGLNLSIGYRFVQGTTTSKTNKLYCDYLNGATLKLGYTGNLVYGQYFSNLSTGYGFGQIGIDVMSFFNKNKSYLPLSMSIGLKRQAKHNYSLVDINYRINEKMQIVLSDAFIAGDPVDSKQERVADLTSVPRVKLNNAFIMAGLKYKTNWKMFNLFGQALAGVFKYERTNLYTMVINSSVPCETLEKNVSLSAEVKGGIQLDFTKDFALNLFGGLSFTATSKKPFDFFYGISLLLN